MSQGIDNAEERIDAPDIWIVLTMARNQRLVMLAEVELQAAPNAVKIAFADPRFDKGRHLNMICQRNGVFASQRQSVLAAEIAMAGISDPVVGEIIFEIDLVEKAGADVVHVDE